MTATECTHRYRIASITDGAPGKPRTAHLQCRDCPNTIDRLTLRTDDQLALDRWLSAETDHLEGTPA